VNVGFSARASAGTIAALMTETFQAPAPLVIGWSHVGIRVHDLDRSLRFYRVLGFELVMGPIGTEPVAILRHPSGLELNLVLNAAKAHADNVLMDVKEKHPGITHLAFAVADVMQAERQMQDAGIVITEGPVTFPNGARSIFVRDPDRNVIELNQAAEH
jgi:lactoylglutathione lyase